jgi:DNA repair protein RadD
MKKLRKYQQDSIEETFIELRSSDDPILFEMSVGGGKSICAGTIAKKFEDAGKRALCLVHSSDLVFNNSESFKSLGGNPSIFCSSLGKKEFSNNIIFATPQSVISAIKSNHPISEIIFNLIIVDEADAIPYKNHKSTFMRILRHYKQLYSPMRLLGLTGTPFRLDNNNTESIVGTNALFKKSVAKISTDWLIKNGYLVKPNFGIKTVEDMDMSELIIDRKGHIRLSSIEKVVESNKRLTWDILQEVQKIMRNRNGAFVFCSSISHCMEAYQALPPELTKIIVGSTSSDEREKTLNDARIGNIKYIISVSCCLIGIDVPLFDCSVFLRRTESLRLFMQAIGRSLRLHPLKKDALILDYAKNLDTFADIDNPIINEALLPKEETKHEFIIPCCSCGGLCTIFTRRCPHITDFGRCTNFFVWKDCDACSARNDQSARYCRQCNYELIDPNAKLTLQKEPRDILQVIESKYWISDHGYAAFNAMYKCTNGLNIYEAFHLKNDRMKNLFYGIVLKKQCKNSSSYYPVLNSIIHLRKMLASGDLLTPNFLECTVSNDKYKIVKRIFESEEIIAP